MMRKLDLLRLVQRLRHRYEAGLRPAAQEYGLTRNEIDVLLFLANNPGLDTASDIVGLRGLSKSHVCKSVDDLTRRGYLAGRVDDRDRRRVHLRLLPDAAPAVRAAQAAQRRFFQNLYRGVSPEERKVLAAVLEKVEHNIKEDTEPCC